MLFVEIIFWISAVLIAAHYIIFPLVIWILAYFRPRPTKTTETCPTVTMIVAAYNEEKVIAEKMHNLLNLDYPSELMQLIIVSDGSTDSTPAIVAQDCRFISLYSPERQGKTHALNRAIEHATCDIVIFSDANSMFERDAVRKLIRNFGESTVGGVCGRKAVIKNEEARAASLGDSTYWNFEYALKQKESLVGSISNADGEIFAVRRNLYKPIPSEIINDDQAITFMLVSDSYRVIYEPMAITVEKASTTLADDFSVKARLVCGGYQALANYRAVINPLKSFFGLQVFLHKTLRYMMVFLLMIVLISSATMIGYSFYELLFLAQFTFYILALLGYILHLNKINISVLYFPMYYSMVNIASFLGFFYFIRKKSVTKIWKKAKR